MSIKILSPLSSPEEVEELVAAGAEEFYCGVMPQEWRDNYSVAASLNRRQEDNTVLKTSPHMGSFEHLAQSAALAHRHGARIVLTLNEHYYDRSQYPVLTRYIEKALESGIDGFIVGDVAMVLTLRSMAPQTRIHISTAGTAFNAETVHFYRDLGAQRVILPRHLSLEEIGELAGRVQDIELEAFIINSRCANIDGFCTFQHGLADFVQDPEQKRNYENACMVLCKISADVKGCPPDEAEDLLNNKISWERQHFWSAVHIDDRPCGACALYEFEEMGLAGVKIVGRQNTLEKKMKDVRFINQALGFLHTEKPSRKEFRQYVQTLYHDRYDSPCLIFKCYYPSVLLDEAE